ncbi:flavin-binding monooxygenase-like domain-containing protein [Ditylenchus destructor]|uniref:Flavin-containing monooxygenase n=1 Tax=Ditylenchus destructor TaxID=166010 RepID=A0AAD4MKK1_9BILA|nr:flavin-binding monooxygenase-like domain-containing protein [Ditylenchus destructor]
MLKKRVAIIGAGPTGMFLARAFKLAADKDPSILDHFEIVCFERQAEWGGLWNFTWRTGLDENGEPVHASMYRNLWSNSPKECVDIPSYMPRDVMCDYLNGRMFASNIKHWFRFKHSVQSVTYDDTTKKFSVTVWNTADDHIFTEEFDYITVATGHFSTPNVPYYPGFDTFSGRIIHSHDFRDAREFTNLNVLVIGNAYSAEDIAVQCWKFGSKSVTISYKTKPTGHQWPEGIDERPILEKLDGRKAYFKDGSIKDEVDSVILCTGYLHSFPFMETSLRLKTDNCVWIEGLYKGVAFEKNTKLFYIGMQDQVYSFPMFDVQAYYVRDVILGRIILPSLERMRQYYNEWQERGAKFRETSDVREKILFQSAYIKELMNDTNYPKFDIDAMNEIFFGWQEDRKLGIMDFRNYTYKSAISGIESAKPKKKWIYEMNDSLYEFLKDE